MGYKISLRPGMIPKVDDKQAQAMIDGKVATAFVAPKGEKKEPVKQTQKKVDKK